MLLAVAVAATSWQLAAGSWQLAVAAGSAGGSADQEGALLQQHVRVATGPLVRY